MGKKDEKEAKKKSKAATGGGGSGAVVSTLSAEFTPIDAGKIENETILNEISLANERLGKLYKEYHNPKNSPEDKKKLLVKIDCIADNIHNQLLEYAQLTGKLKICQASLNQSSNIKLAIAKEHQAIGSQPSQMSRLLEFPESSKSSKDKLVVGSTDDIARMMESIIPKKSSTKDLTQNVETLQKDYRDKKQILDQQIAHINNREAIRAASTANKGNAEREFRTKLGELINSPDDNIKAFAAIQKEIYELQIKIDQSTGSYNRLLAIEKNTPEDIAKKDQELADKAKDIGVDQADLKAAKEKLKALETPLKGNSDIERITGLVSVINQCKLDMAQENKVIEPGKRNITLLTREASISEIKLEAARIEIALSQALEKGAQTTANMKDIMNQANLFLLNVNDRCAKFPELQDMLFDKCTKLRGLMRAADLCQAYEDLLKSSPPSHDNYMRVRDCAIESLRHDQQTDPGSAKGPNKRAEQLAAFINQMNSELKALKESSPAVQQAYMTADRQEDVVATFEQLDPAARLTSMLHEKEEEELADRMGEKRERDAFFEAGEFEASIMSAGNNVLAMISKRGEPGGELVWRQYEMSRENASKLAAVQRQLSLAGLEHYVVKTHASKQIPDPASSNMVFIQDFMPICTTFNKWSQNTRAEADINKRKEAMINRTDEMLAFADTLLQNRILFPDIKPGNFLIGPDGKFVISDLKTLNIAENMNAIDKQLLECVSPDYAPPENETLGTKGPITQNDVDKFQAYLIGVSMYEMITGKSVMDMERKDMAGQYKLRDHTFTWDQDVFKGNDGEKLRQVLEGLTRKDPDKRLTMREAITMMQECKQLHKDATNTSVAPPGLGTPTAAVAVAATGGGSGRSAMISAASGSTTSMPVGETHQHLLVALRFNNLDVADTHIKTIIMKEGGMDKLFDAIAQKSHDLAKKSPEVVLEIIEKMLNALSQPPGADVNLTRAAADALTQLQNKRPEILAAAPKEPAANSSPSAG